MLSRRPVNSTIPNLTNNSKKENPAAPKEKIRGSQTRGRRGSPGLQVGKRPALRLVETKVDVVEFVVVEIFESSHAFSTASLRSR
jgi:hypothetical protein